MARTRVKHLLFALISMLAGLAAVAVLLELTCRVLPTTDVLYTQPVNAAHPAPRFAPDRDVTITRGRLFEHVVERHVNNAGYLSDQDYLARGSPPLLAAVGDSYVEATQVAYAETFHGRLAARAAGHGRVYGFGVSGAQLPTYQVLARQARARYGADGCVIVIIANDFDESLLAYKSAPAFHYYRRTADGDLDMHRVDYAPTALSRVARRSALARYLFVQVGIDPATLLDRVLRRARAQPAFVGNTAADAGPQRLVDSRQAVDHFLRTLPRFSGLAPGNVLFVVDGIRPQLYDADALAAVSGSYFARMRDYFIARARAADFEVIDLQPRFVADHAAQGRRFEFVDDAHWNAAGHAVVAAAIAESALYRRLIGAAR